MESRQVLQLLLPMLVGACVPRIQVRSDVPPRVSLGEVTQRVSVTPVVGSPDVVTLLDPLEALSRTLVVPQVAEYLERRLAEESLFSVLTGCRPQCPQADLRIEVEITASHVNRGQMATGTKSGTQTTAAASVALRVVQSDSLRFGHSYDDSSP